MYAIVLIPVMFAAIIVGALLGGGARSTTACEASYSVGGGAPARAGPRARPGEDNVLPKTSRISPHPARRAR